MAGKKPLDRWIAEAMSDTSKEGPITALSVVHMAGGNSNMTHGEVHTQKFGGTGQFDPKVLADMFRNKAETYCQDMPGVQYFALWAMYGTNEPQAKQVFLVNNVQENEGWAGSEPPNETGMRMQTMRHKEMGMQQIYQRQAQMDEHNIMMIREMGSHLREVMRENRECISVARDAIMKEATNTHNLRMTELAFERATAERKKWFSFGPPLINRLMGSEIFPHGMTDTLLLEQAAAAITPEVAMALAEKIPAELWGPFAGRLHELQVKQREEREATSKLARYEGNGEDDVTGGRH